MFKNYIYFCCHKFRLWSIIGSNVRRKIYIIGIFLALFSCTEEIDKSNCYTFTGETVADYLQNRSDKYSHFISLLERANLLGLLSTYGQYTLFLPDNDAVEKYIQKQDSIYHATKDSDNPIWTGITSPLFEDLSDSMATVIACNHVLETMHRMVEMGEGALTNRNFINRFLGINYVVKGEKYYIMLNNSAAIIGGDNMVENGVVHIVDKVIAPSQKNIPELINTYPFFKIFAEALNVTRFCDSLKLDNDDSYNYVNYTIKDQIGGNIYAPETRYYKFTGFIEPDEVFNKNGIYSLNNLVSFAEKWYGTEDKGDYTSPRNALNKFVAYHFVPRELPHNKIVPYSLKYYETDFDQRMPSIYDRYDYFETMTGTLMKVTKPLSKPEGRDTYINYTKRAVPYNMELRNHLDVRVIPLTEFILMKKEYASFNQNATNGIVHPIDKILIYNEDEMYGNILNERIRIDALSLIPELSCNGVRYNSYKKFVIPDVYSENIKVRNGNMTVGHFLNYYTYNSDAIILNDFFDVEFTLPHLPQRVYEIRVGIYNGGAHNSSMHRPLYPIQIYIDGKPEGNTFIVNYTDNAPNIQNPTGYVSDSETYDGGLENDKVMRHKGWMKAPLVFNVNNGVAARYSKSNMRKIITQKYLDSAIHKIRFRLVSNLNHNLFLDYLEFVPLHIITDPTKPEDRY